MATRTGSSAPPASRPSVSAVRTSALASTVASDRSRSRPSPAVAAAAVVEVGAGDDASRRAPVEDVGEVGDEGRPAGASRRRRRAGRRRGGRRGRSCPGGRGSRRRRGERRGRSRRAATAGTGAAPRRRGRPGAGSGRRPWRRPSPPAVVPRRRGHAGGRQEVGLVVDDDVAAVDPGDEVDAAVEEAAHLGGEQRVAQPLVVAGERIVRRAGRRRRRRSRPS